jgi:hypothetical protein
MKIIMKKKRKRKNRYKKEREEEREKLFETVWLSERTALVISKVLRMRAQ